VDATKLDALVHYICARCEKPGLLGATKLNKVLWYSDVFAYAQDGQSITGAVYVKQQFGPVPKGIMGARARLEASGAIMETKALSHGYSQTQFIACKPADISIFTAAQISLVDSVLEAVCTNHTASSISRLSHDSIWDSAALGEEIPMAAAAFGGHFGDIDDSDMAWARGEVDRIERVCA